jgi:YD repeat-containing protein
MVSLGFAVETEGCKMACVLLGIGRFFRDRGRVFIAMASLLFFSATGAFAAAVVLPCEYRVEVDADGNYRFDQARVGRTADGANRRVWAQFNLSALPAGGLVSNAGFRVFNDWSGANISSLRYTAIRPSAGPSALAAQHTFANRYAGFSWSIDTDDAWTPGEGDFFRPDWSAWPRGNGNTLVQDVQAHLDDGKTWFAVQFDCFACDPVANLRLPPPDESFSWSIVMELEIADAVALVPEKNFGPCVSCPDCPSAGNPINFATGNKYETEIDLDLSGPGLPLRFVRYYNSQREQDGFFGYGWTGSFSEALAVETGKIILREADGREVHFPDDGAGTFVSEADRVRTINPETGGYLLAEPDGKTLSFDTAGKLLRIADRNGNTQTVTYDMNDRIASVADNFGRQLIFTPDIDGRLAILTTPVGDFDYTYADGNLTAATKPDATTRQYRYEDANDPRNLTGIVNENQVLYARFTYDDQDRATGSEYIGGSHGASITYNSDLTRRVTDGRGNATEFTLDARHGMGRVASSTGSRLRHLSGVIGRKLHLQCPVSDRNLRRRPWPHHPIHLRRPGQHPGHDRSRGDGR